MPHLSALLLTLFSAGAHAQAYVDPVEDMMDEGAATVFVSPFQPTNAEAAGLAGMMSSFLESELSRRPDVMVIPIDAVPPVHDMVASLYLESCPPGQQVGCAFVVGEVAAADYALTGTVQSDVQGTRVEIAIIDVLSSREAMSFVAVLGVGEDERFAEGVASVLSAVIRGDAGRIEDIRDLTVVPEADYSAAAAQLAQLSAELGDIQTQTDRSGAVIVPPQITAEEISDRMDREGVKPWERVGLGPDEYLRWRNSGEDLATWRARHDGRKQRVMVRAGFGFFRGPTDGVYRGIYAQTPDPALLVDGTVENLMPSGHAWQTMAAGSGFMSEFAVGYGLTPELEVGALLGFVSGQYQTRVESIFFDQNGVENAAPTAGVNKYTNSNYFMGAYAQYVFMPAARFRPLVGAGVLRWVGETVEDKEGGIPSELGSFDAPSLWMIQFKGGMELELSRRIDLFMHMPITVNLGGASSDVYSFGEGESHPETGQAYIDTTSDQPPSPSPVGGGVLVGMQFKFLGRTFE